MPRKRNSSNELKARINCLNFEIKQFYHAKKKANVQKSIRPGNCKSLWTAVNLAKDTGTPDIPNNMFLIQPWWLSGRACGLITDFSLAQWIESLSGLYQSVGSLCKKTLSQYTLQSAGHRL